MLCRTLLKVVFKDFVHSSPASMEGEVEEVVKKVEYIYSENLLVIAIYFSRFTFGEYFSFFYTHSLPDILTPPPKA